MTEKTTKEEVMQMAVADLEILFNIIGDLSFVGYKISLCKLKGYSYQQCATKFGITKPSAQTYYEKCCHKGYDVELKRIFNLKTLPNA